MTANSKTFAFGTLEETGDTWLLIARDRLIPLDVTLSDLSLEHKTVSVIGKMGIPPSAPGITKLIVEKLVTHDDIAKRAYEIYKGHGGSADENWFQAERDLLHV
jgi:Protein of unknown function (DUF2934)